MTVQRDDQEFLDRTARATRVISVDGSGAPILPEQLTPTFARYADAGPTGVTAHGTHAIPAGLLEFSVAVAVASGEDSPTLDGVAIPANATLTFRASDGNTLGAAELVTSAGDDVLFLSVG